MVLFNIGGGVNEIVSNFFLIALIVGSGDRDRIVTTVKFYFLREITLAIGLDDGFTLGPDDGDVSRWFTFSFKSDVVFKNNLVILGRDDLQLR